MSVRLATQSDISTIVRIALHPSVRATYGCEDKDDDWVQLRIQHTWERFMYFLLEDGRGFFMLERMDDDGKCYSCHAAALPSVRGRELMAEGIALRDWLKEFGVEELWAWTTHDNRQARVFAAWMGMRQSPSPGFCPWIYTEEEGRWMKVNLKEHCHVGR